MKIATVFGAVAVVAALGVGAWQMLLLSQRVDAAEQRAADAERDAAAASDAAEDRLSIALEEALDEIRAEASRYDVTAEVEALADDVARLSGRLSDAEASTVETAAAVRSLGEAVQSLADSVASIPEAPRPAAQPNDVFGSLDCIIQGGSWSDPLQACID